MNWRLPLISLLLVILAGCAPYKVDTGHGAPVNANFTPDPQTEAMIAPYRVALDSMMNEVIAELAVDLKRIKTDPETPLGNLVADLVLELGQETADRQEGFPRPHMALLNFGGLRTSLAKGPVTRGNIFELMPFENNVVVVEMTKTDIDSLCIYLAKQGGQPVSGLQMAIDNGKPRDVVINGDPVKDQTYYVVTSDYLANGGDKMAFFVGKKQWPIIKLRDAIMNYFERQESPISAQIEGRIIHAQ